MEFGAAGHSERWKTSAAMGAAAGATVGGIVGVARILLPDVPRRMHDRIKRLPGTLEKRAILLQAVEMAKQFGNNFDLFCPVQAGPRPDPVVLAEYRRALPVQVVGIAVGIARYRLQYQRVQAHGSQLYYARRFHQRRLQRPHDIDNR